MIERLKLDGFEPEGCAYGFYGRKGGASGGYFDSLNMRAGTGDADDAVAENYRRVCSDLKVAEGHLVYLTQVHGNLCHKITEPISGAVQGDALVTSVPGLAVAVLTADCAPVLFSGKTPDGSPVVGAAHAGWGGAVKGILESTIAAMEEEGASRTSIRAAVGPCIGRLSYEVSPEFLAPFLVDDPASEVFFTALHTGKYLFDLAAYCQFRLKRAGVPGAILSGRDTYKEAEAYFSYRRDTHEGHEAGGRQVSAICIGRS